MSTTTSTSTTLTGMGGRDPWQPAPRPSVARAMRDGLIIAQRNLTRVLRRPDLITFLFVQPIIFTLLFVYVLGGAIESSIQGFTYAEFAMPGIIVITLIFDAPVTAIGLNEDLQKGTIDRLRSLPTPRASVLIGRMLADTVRALVLTLVITGVGYLVGFRFQNGLLPALGLVLVAVLFAQGIAWGSAIIGLVVPSAEAVQAAVFTAIFPLAFASSVYVPIETMPGWLQAFAKINPITVVSDAARALALGGPVASTFWSAIAWSVGLIAVCAPIAINRFQKLT